jgi:hypothetical protein
MSDPVSHLKRELLAAAERQQRHAVLARKSRRRWLERFDVQQGGRRRRVVALAAAAFVAVVATAVAVGGVRDFFLDRGFIGLPPIGATHSAPQSGDLVVHWQGFSATLPGGPVVGAGGPIVRAWVYADGRIIWDRRSHGGRSSGQTPEAANELNSGYLEQRLTPDGVQLVRSEVAGLLDRSRTLLETIPADANPLWLGHDGRLALFVPNDYRSVWGSVEVRDGDRLVGLDWRSNDHRKGSDLEGPIATPEQLSALRRVDTLLTDPASVLPPSAWAERKVRAYVPSHYAVCIDTSPPKDATQLLSLLPVRAAGLLRDRRWTQFGGEVVEAPNVVLGKSVTYCWKVETERAREVAEALSGLDREPGWRDYVLAYRVAEAVNHLNPTRLWFEPYFPHDQFTFSGPFG